MKEGIRRDETRQDETRQDETRHTKRLVEGERLAARSLKICICFNACEITKLPVEWLAGKSKFSFGQTLNRN